MPRCDECGNNSVARVSVDDAVVRECRLCGYLDGPAGAVERLHEQREAREHGIDALIYPLVKTIAQLPGLRVLSSQPGDPDLGFHPTVIFEITERRLDSLKKLLTSLVMINRETHARWVVEVDLQRDLCFVLKPTAPVAFEQQHADEVQRVQADLTLMTRRLRQDQALSWWHE